MAKYKVLSTKKLEPSLIEEAKQSNIEIVEREFISVKPIASKEKYVEVIPWVLSSDINHIVFTSAHAVETVKNYLRQGATWLVPNWNIFCISGKTKDSLNPYISPNRVIATAEQAKDLAQKILELNVKEIVFFCGNKRREELPSILKEAGVIVHEIVIYETIETPQVSTEDIDAILFFSPSAVTSFFSLNQLKKNTVCFAIGHTTADSIADFTDNKIIVSESPSKEMIIKEVLDYFKQKSIS
jgi:uroporphyrinogen-III synthase